VSKSRAKNQARKKKKILPKTRSFSWLDYLGGFASAVGIIGFFLSKLPENPRLLNLGMNGCPEGRPFLSARRQGTMACSGHGTEDKFAN
jgi:hypothetical protein